jgi:hypothetical protein
MRSRIDGGAVVKISALLTKLRWRSSPVRGGRPADSERDRLRDAKETSDRRFAFEDEGEADNVDALSAVASDHHEGAQLGGGPVAFPPNYVPTQQDERPPH